MESVKTIIVPSEGLTCPVCRNDFNLGENKPISFECCGNTICSFCLQKIPMCPLCRKGISNPLNYPKNVLLCSLLESQTKTNLCKTHKKPLEIFCKLHKQLLCFHCVFKDGHFSHIDDIIQLSEVKTRAKRTKDCLEKIEKKKAESKQRLYAFSQEKKKTLKRVIDETFNEHIDPLLALKEKFHLEADSVVFVQNGKYDFENIEEKQEDLKKWKEKFFSLINEWELSPSGKTASKLLKNNIGMFERKPDKIEEEVLLIEDKMTKRINNFLLEMKSKLRLLRLKKNSKRIWEMSNKMKFEKNPRIHLERLVRYLEEHGLQVAVKNDQETPILKSSNKQELMASKNDDKDFSCILEELSIEFNNLQTSEFNLFCRIIRQINCLEVFSLKISHISDQGLLFLGKSIQSSPSIEEFMIDFCLISNSAEKTLEIFWTYLTHLPNLKKLVMQIHLQNGTGDLTPLYKDPELSNLSKIEEVELSFRSQRISQRGVGFILQSLKTGINIKKLSITITDSTNMETKICEELGRLCGPLKDLEKLIIQFTASSNDWNMNVRITLYSLVTSTLNSEKCYKLHISCSHFPFLVSSSIVDHIFRPLIAKQIKELTIDLLTCEGVTEESLINEVDEYCQLFQLRKLVLELNYYSFHKDRLQFIMDHLSQVISNGTVTIHFSRQNQNN